MSNSNPGFAGAPEGDDLSNALFLIKQQNARIRTHQVAKIIKVYPGNNSSKPTIVDIQVMVDQVDSDGTRQAHDTVFGIPVPRWHGGKNAILVDPAIGDVGSLLVCDRDISSVIANEGKQSAPGSGRRHDFSDSLYVGGVWTPQPDNYHDLRSGNIAHVSPGNIAAQSGKNISDNATQSHTRTSQNQNISDSAPSGKILHAAKMVIANGQLVSTMPLAAVTSLASSIMSSVLSSV